MAYLHCSTRDSDSDLDYCTMQKYPTGSDLDSPDGNIVKLGQRSVLGMEIRP